MHQSKKINNTTFVIHIMFKSESINAAVTHENYPSRIIFNLLRQDPSDDLFKLYQIPQEVDKLIKIQHQLDDNRKVIVSALAIPKGSI